MKREEIIIARRKRRIWKVSTFSRLSASLTARDYLSSTQNWDVTSTRKLAESSTQSNINLDFVSARLPQSTRKSQIIHNSSALSFSESNDAAVHRHSLKNHHERETDASSLC